VLNKSNGEETQYMKLAMIGFGQAGGKIIDKFVEYDQRHGSNIVQSAIAVNTAKADLMGLESIPTERRVLIGQARVKGHGVGADNELGAEIAKKILMRYRGPSIMCLYTKLTHF
jgi:Cell division GTPase